MCTLAVAFKAHPRYPVVLASNRDEFFARPAAPAGYWEDRPAILAGRDLRAGGTWLGVRTDGRFGALTNIREPGDRSPVNAPSRGEIIPAFLESELEPEAFALDLQKRADRYDGFNLLVGDDSALVYFSNRQAEPRVLAPGVYGMSNAVLGTAWPKVRRAARGLEILLAEDSIKPEALLDLLADADRPADELLPETGVGLEWERLLSPIFIKTPEYGTYASTAYILDDRGTAQFVERRTLPGDETERRYIFQVSARSEI